MSLDKTAKTYIINAIDASGYDASPKTNAEKIAFLRATFNREYGHEIKRQGIQGAVSDWLRGLPSAVNLPFCNADIIDLAISWGSLPANPSEKQAERITANYWNFMAAKMLQLFNGYRVPKEG